MHLHLKLFFRFLYSPFTGESVGSQYKKGLLLWMNKYRVKALEGAYEGLLS